MKNNKQKMIFDFSLYPLDKGDSLSKFVSNSMKIIEESGLPYKFGAMSTSIEGTWNECMQVIETCHQKMQEQSERIVLNLKVDYRKDRKDGIINKIASVENKVGHKLKI
ncbi:MAG: MTH1187 family thiamine-binding protein [Deltaproteobacteria bacterium]|nr:MTH1187 family thiamine-binding protein [Deltaproteobacteria bacterium]